MTFTWAWCGQCGHTFSIPEQWGEFCPSCNGLHPRRAPQESQPSRLIGFLFESLEELERFRKGEGHRRVRVEVL